MTKLQMHKDFAILQNSNLISVTKHTGELKHCSDTAAPLQHEETHRWARFRSRDQYSHFFSSIPSGGLPSTFFEPTSFQFVESTVPLDSTYTRQNIHQKAN